MVFADAQQSNPLVPVNLRSGTATAELFETLQFSRSDAAHNVMRIDVTDAPELKGMDYSFDARWTRVVNGLKRGALSANDIQHLPTLLSEARECLAKDSLWFTSRALELIDRQDTEISSCTRNDLVDCEAILSYYFHQYSRDIFALKYSLQAGEEEFDGAILARLARSLEVSTCGVAVFLGAPVAASNFVYEGSIGNDTHPAVVKWKRDRGNTNHNGYVAAKVERDKVYDTPVAELCPVNLGATWTLRLADKVLDRGEPLGERDAKFIVASHERQRWFTLFYVGALLTSVQSEVLNCAAICETEFANKCLTQAIRANTDFFDIEKEFQSITARQPVGLSG